MTSKFNKSDVIALFEELGVKTAAKWNAKRLMTKFLKVEELAEERDDLSDEALDVLAQFIEAQDNEITIEIVDDEDAEGEEVPEEEETEEEETEEEETEEEETEEAPAPKKEAKKPKPKTKSNEMGVRLTNVRSYLAGKIVAENGMDSPLGKELIKKLDDVYGKVNKRESEVAIRNAWQAIRGYLEVMEG